MFEGCICALLQGYWSCGAEELPMLPTFPWLCLKDTKWLKELHEVKVSHM